MLTLLLITLDEDANVNILHHTTSLTPLQIACSLKFPNVETIRALLQNGANANTLNTKGQTPFICVIEQYIEMLNSEEYNRDRVIETTISSLKELARMGARFVDDDLKILRQSFRDSILAAKEAWITQQV